jgi:hypothetical protein
VVKKYTTPALEKHILIAVEREFLLSKQFSLLLHLWNTQMQKHLECCRELRDSRQRKNSEENTNCIALPRELELSEQKTIVEEQYEVFAEQKAS